MSEKTALANEHESLGAKMVDFHGWWLPIQYSGVMDEHLACRNAAGLFDTSHMGELIVRGARTLDFLNYLCTHDFSKLVDGQAKYSVMCNEQGGIIDDLIVYRRGPEDFFVVVNAANLENDFKHFQKIAGNYEGVTVENESAAFTQIAIQGPKAREILQNFVQQDLGEVKRFRFFEEELLGGSKALIARTGYTGEDGFEIYCPWGEGPAIWSTLVEKGKPLGLKACGLAARDTLRTEAKLPLHGSDIDESTNPLEAGLGWLVKFEKTDFMGKEALLKIKEEGLKRKWVGIELNERGIPRPGYPLFSTDGQEIGILTSGTHSPSLKKPIGLGYVKAPHFEIGSAILVEIRGKKLQAEVVQTPFIKK